MKSLADEAETTDVRVAVRARDRLTEDLLIQGLGSIPGLVPLRGDEADVADVILFMVNDVDEAVMNAVVGPARRRPGRASRPVVLVCRRISELQVLQALDHELVRVVPWSDLGVRELGEVIRGSGDGSPSISADAIPGLMGRLRRARELDGPRHEVSARELEVIRLLADGLSTLDIAAKLNFSDRTIKGIVIGLSTRFALLNRAHLVAYAFRNGII